MVPFVKWAGGKKTLLNEIDKKIDGTKSFYYEPFVGGGAVFFHALRNYNFQEYHINDLNTDLINCYIDIKDNYKQLSKCLEYLKQSFEAANDKEAFYLDVRNKYNTNKSNQIVTSAMFIFLNKTCYNGLMRYNSKGIFNCPFGKKSKFNYGGDNLFELNFIFNKKNVYFTNLDFKDIQFKNNCFVYFDPPYRPTKKGSFVEYNKSKFNDVQQIELAEISKTLDSDGNKFCVSNSFTPDFFKEHYPFNMDTVYCRRNINSNGSARDEVEELLIYN